MTGRDAVILLGLVLAIPGCASTERMRSSVARSHPEKSLRHQESPSEPAADADSVEPAELQLVSRVDEPSAAPGDLTNVAAVSAPAEPNPFREPDSPAAVAAIAEAASVPLPIADGGLTLDHVQQSVLATYPLLIAELEGRRIAAGAQLEAWGSFDTKLSGAAINQPLGDYENYRYALGLKQPTMWGGEIYSGYRIGRGEFEPWYKERETDDGGEFKAGIAVPFAQNRAIDLRRAELRKTTFGVAGVEFGIQGQLIAFIQSAALTYWEWVAAGEVYRISEALLDLARARVAYLEEQVDAERLPPIALIDNQRLIVSREAKLIEAQQKLQVSAIKLSLFLRDPGGVPIVPSPSLLPERLPEPEPFASEQLESDIAVALSNRPEIRELLNLRQQLEVDLSLARNLVLPAVDGTLGVSQDVGQDATSSAKGPFGPNDKDELILEAGLLVEVPLQRRKARGKMLAAEAKLAQNAAKLGFMRNKVTADVQQTAASLAAAYAQYQRATEAVELNRQLEEAERIRLQEQRSDLLLLNLREQATADAALARVEAWLAWFQAAANRRAAMALDVINEPAAIPPSPSRAFTD